MTIFIRRKLMYSKARVVDFRRGSVQYGCAVKGNSGRQYQRGAGGYCNGNGMYLSYPEYFLWVKLVVYKPEPHTVILDIRDEALEASGRERITEKYIEAIKEENCGRKIGVITRGYDNVKIADFDELDLDV